MWLRCQQLASLDYKDCRAAGGATASNGSLIFLDVERRDPVRDSPQLEKAHFAQVDSAKVMDRLSHQNWYESNLEQRWIYTSPPHAFQLWKKMLFITVLWRQDL